VRHPLTYLLQGLAYLGIVPAEVPLASELLNIGADGYVGLAREKAISVQYYILAQKPNK